MNHYFYKVDSTDHKRMRDLFGMTMEYGLLDVTFYGQVKSVADFIGLMQDAHLYAVIQEDIVVGYTWLNMFSGRAANSHVCLFPNAKDKEQLGLDFTKMVFDSGHYDTLVGLVPDKFTHAGTYAIVLGYRHAAVIPNAIELDGEVMSMHLFILTKED